MNRVDAIVGVLLEDTSSREFVSRLGFGGVTSTGEHESWVMTSASAVIRWRLDLDCQEWGVSRLNPVILEAEVVLDFDTQGQAERITLDFDLSKVSDYVPTEETDDIKDVIDYHIGTVRVKTEWFYCKGDGHSPEITPNEVSVDLSTKLITVFF